MKSAANSSAVIAGIICLTVVQSSAAAQKNANQSQQTKQAKAELDAAQNKLRDARQELDKAEKELSTSTTAHQNALAQVQKAKQTAIQRVGPKLGLPAAQAEHNTAIAQVGTARNTLLASLKTQPDYQAATQATEDAREKMSKLPGDTALTDEQRAAKTAEYSAALRKPAELQKQAEAGDAQLQEAQRRFKASELQLSTVLAQVQKAIANDEGIKDAEEKLRDAITRLNKAKDAVAREQKQFNTAQATVNREQQQYQQAQTPEKKKKKK